MRSTALSDFFFGANRVSSQMLQSLENRFEFVATLGEGTFGLVGLMFDKKNKTRVAVKRMKGKWGDEGIPTHCIREISAMRCLRHDNIVAIKDVFMEDEASLLAFTMERHSTNLHEVIQKSSPLPVGTIRKYLKQLLLATEYMHSRHMVHRDLKPQNILLSESDCIKVCDFGQAKSIPPYQSTLSTSISTIWYRAPEVMRGDRHYSFAVDLWAIGTIFAEMVLGCPLFKANHEIGMLVGIMQLCGTP